jgi:replicative DNA helicase
MEFAAHDFGPDFEDKIIDMILTNPKFVDKFRPIISEQAFTPGNNRFIINEVTDYYDKYGHPPSVGVLADVIRKGLYGDKGGVIERIESATEVPDFDYVRDRIVSWVKWTAIDKVLNSQNGELPKEFAKKIEVASRVGDDLLMVRTRLDTDYEDEDSRNDIIETPWNWLNNVLDGGPEKGDLAVILTIISGGKTTTLVNIARHALMLGKFVVYFTFEDGERKIKRRFIQSIANMSRQEIINGKSRAYRRRDKFITKYGGYCEIKDLQSRRTTVDDARSIIKTLEDLNERKVDIVLTDYADRFRANNRYSEPRHALREVFEDCKWLARDLDVVHWTARQSNKRQVGKEVVSTDAASESWGSMESPDLVIGLGRSLEDEDMGRITLYTAKVRDAEDHQMRSLVADFERQRIYDPSDFE